MPAPARPTRERGAGPERRRQGQVSLLGAQFTLRGAAFRDPKIKITTNKQDVRRLPPWTPVRQPKGKTNASQR